MTECSGLATMLDKQMLAARGVTLASPNSPDATLPIKTGRQVSQELGGRLLLRYILAAQIRSFTSGSLEMHFVTPTAYTPTEAVKFLALPEPDRERPYVLVLGPAGIERILGPREVMSAHPAIEYILPQGFPPNAFVGAGGPWALVVS